LTHIIREITSSTVERMGYVARREERENHTRA